MDTLEILTPVREAEQLMSAADDAWEAGDAELATNLAREALGVCPGHLFALHMLGLIAFAGGDSHRAIDYLLLACSQPEAPAIFHRNLCEAYRQSGRLTEAEAEGRAAVKVDARLAVGWNSLGAVYFDAGKLPESRDCYQTALTLVPEYSAAANSLAITFYKLGELGMAKEQLLRTLELDETNADAHCTLSLVLGGLGEFDDALVHVRRAVEIAPKMVNAYLNGAALEAQTGRYDQLFRWVEQAYAVDPNNVHVLLMYANAARRLERYEDGVNACRRAIALLTRRDARHPKLPGAYDTLALMLQDLEKGDDALAAFDVALALALEIPSIAPTELPAVVANNRAMLLMELGRKDDALAGLDHSLALRPDHAMAWYNRADLKKFAAGDIEIDRMEELLHRDPVPTYINQVRLHFALGKAYLDCASESGSAFPGGERGGRGVAFGDLAFEHFTRGNSMKRGMIKYDGGQQERFMQSIAEALPKTVIDALAGQGDPSQTPVFVVGMPRSGTTLVEQILASHPMAHGVGEKLHVERILCGAGLVVITDDGPRATALSDSPFLNRGGGWGEGLSDLGQQYLSLVTPSAPGAARIVDKLPSNFHYAGYIHLTFPNARIIHCRRNAADVCLSCYCKHFSGQQDFTYDLVELAEYYRAYAGLMDHWRAVLPASNYLEIEYESMVDGFEDNVRRLVDFCGLPWDDTCLRFYDTKRIVKTASLTQVRSPIYKTSVGRWRPFEKHLAPLLAILREHPNRLDRPSQ